jgi:hypothetical protein
MEFLMIITEITQEFGANSDLKAIFCGLYKSNDFSS